MSNLWLDVHHVFNLVIRNSDCFRTQNIRLHVIFSLFTFVSSGICHFAYRNHKNTCKTVQYIICAICVSALSSALLTERPRYTGAGRAPLFWCVEWFTHMFRWRYVCLFRHACLAHISRGQEQAGHCGRSAAPPAVSLGKLSIHVIRRMASEIFLNEIYHLFR